MALTEYVMMPGEDYQAACDMLRSKTGKTDLIKSGDLETEIGNLFAGEIVEKTVEAVFSSGDMEVAAADGDYMSKVTVTKPETLIPENIAEGVDIAGIIGTLARGALCATGSFTGNGGAVTVTHGLGVVPDIIFVACMAGLTTTPSTKFLDTIFGVSKAFKDKYGWPYSYQRAFYFSTATTYTTTSLYNPITNTYATHAINNANEQTVVIGASSGNGATYRGGYKWFAIGGLT